jgi:hypothetical protein
MFHSDGIADITLKSDSKQVHRWQFFVTVAALQPTAARYEV